MRGKRKSTGAGTSPAKRPKLSNPIPGKDQRKSRVKSVDSVAVDEEESEFPRGGKEMLTPLEKRLIKQQTQQDVFFGEGAGDEVSSEAVGVAKERKKKKSSGKRYIALDVECVATGRRHDDRNVCLVAVVDANEEVILKRKVKPDKPVVSYLTPLTGVKRGDLDDGERLSVVLRDVKALLGPDVILVGQGTKSDIKWLQLEQGKDYDSVVDLGQMFKTYNSRYGNYSYFSLSHEANTLIQAGFISEPHAPETDSIAAMKLFKKYYGKQSLIEQAKRQLMARRPPTSWAKQNNYRWEGVCMAAYTPSKCFCGAPTYT